MTEPGQGELPAIIARAYRIFAPYTPDPGTRLTVCYCDCCMTPETEAALRTTPLASISTALLSEYTNSAHGCDDHITCEFRYFLPRYMELMGAGDVPCYNGLEFTFARIADVDWRESWPAQEVQVLEEFFDALLLQTLQDVSVVKWPAGWFLATDISDVLVLVVRANGDFARVLRTWDEAADPYAAIHMAGARGRVTWHDGVALHGSALLAQHGEAARAIAAFLMRPEVDARLERAFFQIDDPKLQAIVSDMISG